MDCVIYENGKAVGTLAMASEGLYWQICCKMKPTKQPHRVYAVTGLLSVYLGIPDARGEMKVRIAKRHLPDAQAALAVTTPKGEWFPWRGEVDGVEVELCYCRQESDGITVALPEAELIKFPAWAGQWNREMVYGQETALLRLDEKGHLPQMDSENGDAGKEATLDGGYIDPLLLAELPADYSYGDDLRGTDGEHL